MNTPHTYPAKTCPSQRHHAACFALLAALLCFLLSLPDTRACADTDPAAQMLLGNPDNATSTPSNLQHYLINRPQYALSYNGVLLFPNWVSWHLNAPDIGGSGRGQFMPDTTLPPSFPVVTPGDYTRSGYDRGHNCPSADRSDTRANNDPLFLMSNMTPQAHGLNAGPWEKLETYCRDLAAQGNELYITCGHAFSAPTHGTIGTHHVAVPDFAWKVIVVLPDHAGNDLARINARTRVIAVRMPNVNTISKQDWPRYIVTNADIEKATGLHFFSALPAPVAAALRLKKDTGPAAGSAKTHRTRHPRTSRKGAAAAPPPTQTLSPLAAIIQRVLHPGTPNTPNAAPSGTGSVWVNTKSGKYFRPGSRYYGHTKQGKYMTEPDAIKAGYVAAE